MLRTPRLAASAAKSGQRPSWRVSSIRTMDWRWAALTHGPSPSLLKMVQEQGHAVGGGLRDELAPRKNDQTGMPGGAQHPHRRGHNGLEGGFQLALFACSARARMSRDRMLRSLISVRCSWSLVGTASAPLGDDRAARHGSGDRCLCRPGSSQRESRAKSGTTYSHGAGSQTRAMALSGRCRTPAAGPGDRLRARAVWPYQ